MLILSYLRTGAEWTELCSSNADWFGLGLLPNGFGPDWIPSNESVSYSASECVMNFAFGVMERNVQWLTSALSCPSLSPNLFAITSRTLTRAPLGGAETAPPLYVS